jgi:ATP-dependent helicase Lhr and Lhr-like helicase
MFNDKMIEYKNEPNTEKQVKKILTPLVEKWFFSRFKEFSLPQLYGVLEIHARQNVLVSAPTGATKTLTAFMAVLNELVDSAIKGILEDKVYCVYISPLKALNNDIGKNLLEPLKEMEEIHGKELGIRVAVRTGDTTQAERSKMLKNVPHILITTPESLGILLCAPKFREHLKDVQWFIADEVHALAENKRGVHLSLSMERLSYLSSHMARVGLSATVAPLEEIAKYLFGTNRDGKIIDVQFIKEMDLKVLSPVPDLINVSHEHLHKKLYEMVNKLVQQHKTTLIFTNTRAATERVVDYLKNKFPKNYNLENIGAHHGSLSAEHRKQLEQDLREGKKKVVVCSTSLELGIDIGFIDLVICLGSPKSVARALQRIGRSGHQLHSTTKGRIIVLDRDDLVECAVLLKAAIEKKIDRIHIPRHALDVLAQHLLGMAIEQVWEEDELFKTVKESYCYSNLSRVDFNELLSYLAGEFVSLEDRHVYAKIWRNKGKVGKRGRMTRVIYSMNIGTIPDRTAVKVKVGTMIVGTLDEGFLERLKPRDVFVLGGNTYEFRYAKGMAAFVTAAVNRPPTIPSWVSEMLPLSFDLAMEIQKFRRLMGGYFIAGKKKKEILEFIEKYLYIDGKTSVALYNYFNEQYKYMGMLPHDKKILVEHYADEEGRKKIVFHTLFGRRVNDVLSRMIAFALAKEGHKNVELGMNDNGFYLGLARKGQIKKALELVKKSDARAVMEQAIEGSEVLRRRFRHVAERALMILRNYMGRKKRVGMKQVSSMILMSALKRISPNFSLLKEARREVLEDQMDIINAESVLEGIKTGRVDVVEMETNVPSPFAFKVVLQGVMDVIKLEDKMQFLQRMHQLVLVKISLKQGKGKKGVVDEGFDYYEEWKKAEERLNESRDEEMEELKIEVMNLEKVPFFVKEQIVRLLEGHLDIRLDVIRELRDREKDIKKEWSKKLSKIVFKKLKEI